MPQPGDPMDHNAMRRYVSQLGLFGLGALLAAPA